MERPTRSGRGRHLLVPQPSNAGALKTNTFSFQLQLGVHPRCRTDEHTPIKDGLLRPHEAACDFRLILVKPFQQRETDRPEIWFVRSDGANLQTVVEAARDHLLTEGFAWFASLDGVERRLEVARDQPLSRHTAGGMGNIGSPHRLSLIADLEAASR